MAELRSRTEWLMDLGLGGRLKSARWLEGPGLPLREARHFGRGEPALSWRMSWRINMLHS